MKTKKSRFKLPIPTMPLSIAHRVLDKADAVIWGQDGHVCYPIVSKLTGKGDNEFLFLETMTRREEEITCSLRERDNETVRYEGASIFFIDPYGEEIEVTMLQSTSVVSLV